MIFDKLVNEIFKAKYQQCMSDETYPINILFTCNCNIDLMVK